MSNVAAYTKRDQVYPGYINATPAVDGMVVVTVRGDPKTVDGNTVCGDTVSVRLSSDEWAALVKDFAEVVL